MDLVLVFTNGKEPVVLPGKADASYHQRQKLVKFNDPVGIAMEAQFEWGCSIAGVAVVLFQCEAAVPAVLDG